MTSTRRFTRGKSTTPDPVESEFEKVRRYYKNEFNGSKNKEA